MEEENVNVTEQLQQIVQSGENVQTQPATAEAAANSVEYAGFWVRFAAMLVDGLVLIIPSIIVSAIFGKTLGTFLQYVLMWIYAIYMLNTCQATFGKMAVGIKVTTVDGGNQTTGKLALREIVGKILNIITLGIGYLMVVFTAKKQGLHDMLADTVVVYDPSRKRRGWLVVLGIVFALIIPIIGILAGVILVSTSSARDKAQKAAVMAYGKSVLPEIITCQADGGNINAYKINNPICDADGHALTWPDVSKLGWSMSASAEKNSNLDSYTFIFSKNGTSDITCGISSNDCR